MNDLFRRNADWTWKWEMQQWIIHRRALMPRWDFAKLAAFALKVALTTSGPYRWNVFCYTMRETFREEN
jgi:hypothetical protein